jgi:membrane protease YdiL (CAAX protease family)
MELSLSAIVLIGTLMSALCASNRFILFLGMGAIGLSALYENIITPSGLGSLGLLTALAFYFSSSQEADASKDSNSLSRLESTKILQLLAWVGILVLSTLAYLHDIPGFSNPKLLSNYSASVASAPFSLYLNFDKTFVALILCTTVLAPVNFRVRVEDLKIAALSLLACIAVLIPLSLAAGYVAFDPKLSAILPLWVMVNILCVAFPEEVLFRGFLQKNLEKWTASPYIALGVASLAFGLFHINGGLFSVALASLAGLFYGYTYQKTNSLFCSTLVHFGVNVIHMCFFTYPVALSFTQIG